MVTHLRTLFLSSCLTALAACGGGGGGGPSTEEDVAAPRVSIGNDQAVDEGQSVTLTPTVIDDDTDPSSLTYQWQVISNHSISLVNANSATVSFSAPMISSTTTIKLQLTVSDGTNSTTDSINIVVNDKNSANPNSAPVVNAGNNTSAASGATVFLNATVTDDDTSLSYAWSQVSGGATVQFSNTAIEDPAVTLPSVQSNTTVVLRLSVSDGTNAPVTDDVSITILAGAGNTSPVVNAGNAQTVNEGVVVQLNGSVIDDGSPTISWQQISGPTVSINNASSASASFTAPNVDQQSVVVLRLTANDNVNPAVSSDVSITINDTNSNNPPQVEAGPNQTVVEGGQFTITPTITDEGGYLVQWNQVSGPVVSITQPTQELQTLTAPLVSEDSTIVLRISVNDGENAIVSDEIEILVTDIPVNNPPIVDAGTDRSVSEGSTVSLTGSVNDEGNPSLVWTQTSGTSVTISNSTSLTAEFTAPNVSEEETLVFELTADDGVNSPVSDSISITVVNIAANVVAGDDQSAMSGNTVNLEPEITGPSNYTVAWTQLSGPNVTINNANAEFASFTAPTVTDVTNIELQISVTFAGNETLTDTVIISVGPQVDALVEYSATAKDDRLACYKGEGQVECNLRMYQMMVVNYRDGDGANWGAAYGDPFGHKSGDIQGIINSLDYIQSLGMNAIWLTPIFVSNTDNAEKSSTGYFASDYFTIDGRFGTIDQARTLVNEAHARGIYVFLDGVFGHYYGPGIQQRNYNGVQLPVRTTNNVTDNGKYHASATYPQDLPFFLDVATHWIRELKIDGWRLDLAYEVPLEHWDDIRAAVAQASSEITYDFPNGQGGTTQVNPLGYMVGEVWRGAQDISDSVYGPEGSPGLLSAFDFPMRYATVQTFAVEESWGVLGSDGYQVNGKKPASRLHARFLADHGAYPSHAMPNLMLSNHDILRFGDLLQRGGIADVGDDEYWNRYRTVHSFQAAYSGPITIYYGEEYGEEREGFAEYVGTGSCNPTVCDDHASRLDGKVDNFSPQEESMLEYTRALMNLREAHPALPNGSRTHIYSDDDIYIDRKDNGDDNILYMVNVTDDPVEIAIVNTAIGSQGRLTDLLGNYDIDIQGDRYYITLEGHTAHFFDIEDPTEEGPQLQYSGSLTGTGPLAACDTPDSNEAGPLDEDMYIRGNYPGGDFSVDPARQLSYKGDNIYQLVVSEVPGTWGFKFANSSWLYEFAVQNSGGILIGAEQVMATASGAGTESTITIPQAGNYVYSFRVNETLDGGELMVSLCP